MKNLKMILLSIATLLPLVANSASFYGKVISIHDGDTLKVKVEGESKPVKVRFLGIDTPEVSYSGDSQGQAAYDARDYLREILPIGSEVKIVESKQARDRGNRVLGTVYFQDNDINLEMISSGHAVPYFIAPFSKRLFYKYSTACHQASSDELNIFGLISDKDLEIPYEFRLNTQGRTGTNLIGDFETKKLFSPENASSVHVCDRIFIKYESYANRLGYSF